MSRTLEDELPAHLASRDWLDSVKDLGAGAVGGAAQVLLGQPFDLVKVRLQTQGGGNAIRMTQKIFLEEGPLAFYTGTLVPLIGIGACVSIQFGAFHYARQLLESRNALHHKRSNPSLTSSQLYLAGGMAGVANSVVSGPVEHVRIRLQTQHHYIHQGTQSASTSTPSSQSQSQSHSASRPLYRGPWDCIRSIHQRGGALGLYRGQSTTLLREFHGYGIWFAAYETMIAWASKWSGRKRDDLSGWTVALCGGLAGDALWLGSYPLDVVKTKMQSDGFGANRVYPSILSVFHDIWRKSGLRGFYFGLGPTLVRTMITSGGTFVTVEQVRKFLG